MQNKPSLHKNIVFIPEIGNAISLILVKLNFSWLFPVTFAYSEGVEVFLFWTNQKISTPSEEMTVVKWTTIVFPSIFNKVQTTVNLINLKKGTVIKSTGSWYQVRFEEGQILECRIVGKLRLDGLKTTNPVAVGDEVNVVPEEEGRGLIKEVLPRRNYVVRQSPRKKHDLHLLAANVDQAVLITTIVEPNLKQGFIDRFLLMTEPYNIPTSLVFNKADVYDEEALEIYGGLKILYESIGYQVMLVSAVSGDGLADLKTLLHGKTTLISGQSGVGKSTLINAIEPSLDLRTGDISDYSGKGQHTTTFAEMFPLGFGGNIIDTPGIKMLAFNNLAPLDVAHNFREIFEKSAECRFGGQCLHKNEPKCAVKEAVESGEISPLRYSNYLNILDEIENQNYWEIHEM